MVASRSHERTSHSLPNAEGIVLALFFLETGTTTQDPRADRGNKLNRMRALMGVYLHQKQSAAEKFREIAFVLMRKACL